MDNNYPDGRNVKQTGERIDPYFYYMTKVIDYLVIPATAVIAGTVVLDYSGLDNVLYYFIYTLTTSAGELAGEDHLFRLYGLAVIYFLFNSTIAVIAMKCFSVETFYS